MAEQTGATGATTSDGMQDGPALMLQKVYVKDLSFESPKAPEIFTQNTSPQTQLNLRYANRDLGQDNVEVTLTITVEAKEQDTTLFLVELSQAGVFSMRGYSEEQRKTILGTFCPNTLYPFAREAIADLVQKGGFPQLLLQPINFDALYAQALKERESQIQAAANAPAAPTPGPGDTH
jgi:preprotein translocase subunit SecB